MNNLENNNRETSNPLIIIDEDDFETSDLIGLNKELIRIIEKDIDSLKASRLGLTPWAIYAALAGIVTVLLGKANDLIGVSAEYVFLMFIFCSFLFQFFTFLIGLITPESLQTKEKRLYYTREKFGGTFLFFIFRFIVLAVLFALIYQYWTQISFKIISLICIFILEFLFGFQIFAYVKNLISGNNPAFNKAEKLGFILCVLSYLILIVFGFFSLKYPVNSGMVTAYTWGALCSIFIFFIELLLSFYFTSPKILELNDLRDDIVFQRISINTALLKYRRIKEGNLFFEMIKEDYEKLYSQMDARDLHLDNLKAIYGEILQTIPSNKDSIETKNRKSEQLKVFSNSLMLAFEKDSQINNDLAYEIKLFLDKTSDLAQKSGDVETKQLIDNIFVNKEKKYFDDRTTLVNELNKLNDILTSTDI